MKHLLRLTDLKTNDVFEIFSIADDVQKGKYSDMLKGKSIVLFFPDTSIRTRVTFERGIYLLGGQPILFPTETLDKKEDLRDVCGYLNQWADMLIIRHPKLELLEEMAKYAKVPVINAMTNCNHPCEILSDLYSLSKIRQDFVKDKYLFCGKKGNIGLAWKEAADTLGLDMVQCCAKGYEMGDIRTFDKIEEAIIGRDIICTDSLPAEIVEEFQDCRVSTEVMKMANEGALLNPCPPFYRGEEVSEDGIASEYFVGYQFKKSLLEVQQAVMIYCLTHS